MFKVKFLPFVAISSVTSDAARDSVIFKNRSGNSKINEKKASKEKFILARLFV